MKSRRKIFTLTLSILFLFLIPSILYAQSGRDFPMPDGLVTDFTGMLSNDDKVQILGALESAKMSNGMDGHVVVVLSTNEWFTQEYVKDYSDYLQGQGVIGQAGYLIYISVEDRKFALAVQDIATLSITEDRRDEIYLKMSLKLEEHNVVGAVLECISSIEGLERPEGAEEQKGMGPDIYVLLGILIIVVVLMMRLRKNIGKKS